MPLEPGARTLLVYSEPPPGFEWRLSLGEAVTFTEEEFGRGAPVRRMRALPADLIDAARADYYRRPNRSASVNYNDQVESMRLVLPDRKGKVWLVIDRWFDPHVHNAWYRLMGDSVNEVGWVRDYPMLGLATLVEADRRERQLARERRGDHG